MELLLSPSPTISTTQIFPLKTHLQTPTINFKFSISSKKNNHLNLFSSSFISCTCFSNSTNATSTTTTTTEPTLTSTPSSCNHHWMVLMEAPPHGVNSKPQVIDYYVKTLERVLGSEKDAQMCIYDASWDTHFGFCCDIDEETSHELASVPGVLSVQPDKNFESENKDYGGNNLQSSTDLPDSSEASQTTPIKTKKLFVTGLSFYTSEKTLCAAFEGFGELVEVKIIMDKISKRSKGYAFIEYTTEEAASAALKEMNGKIINGWMIVVDVAKTNPPRYSSGRPKEEF